MLSNGLKISEASMSAKIDMTKHWLSVQSGLTQEQKDKINNLNIKGLI